LSKIYKFYSYHDSIFGYSLELEGSDPIEIFVNPIKNSPA